MAGNDVARTADRPADLRIGRIFDLDAVSAIAQFSITGRIKPNVIALNEVTVSN